MGFFADYDKKKIDSFFPTKLETKLKTGKEKLVKLQAQRTEARKPIYQPGIKDIATAIGIMLAKKTQAPFGLITPELPSKDITFPAAKWARQVLETKPTKQYKMKGEIPSLYENLFGSVIGKIYEPTRRVSAGIEKAIISPKMPLGEAFKYGFKYPSKVQYKEVPRAVQKFLTKGIYETPLYKSLKEKSVEYLGKPTPLTLTTHASLFKTALASGLDQKAAEHLSTELLHFATDPIIWFTFGARPAPRVGGRFLNKRGFKMLQTLSAAKQGMTKGQWLKAGGFTNLSSTNQAAMTAARGDILNMVLSKGGGKYVQLGGLKVFGKTIVSQDTFSKMSKRLKPLFFKETKIPYMAIEKYAERVPYLRKYQNVGRNLRLKKIISYADDAAYTAEKMGYTNIPIETEARLRFLANIETEGVFNNLEVKFANKIRKSQIGKAIDRLPISQQGQAFKQVVLGELRTSLANEYKQLILKSPHIEKTIYKTATKTKEVMKWDIVRGRRNLGPKIDTLLDGTAEVFVTHRNVPNKIKTIGQKYTNNIQYNTLKTCGIVQDWNGLNLTTKEWDLVRQSLENSALSISPKIRTARDMLRQEFNIIRKAEQQAGIMGEGLEDYLTHIFERKLTKSERIKLGNMFQRQLFVGTKTPFAKHRLHAGTIDDIIKEFGDEKLLKKDPRVIFAIRKAYSDKALEKIDFFNTLKGAGDDVVSKIYRPGIVDVDLSFVPRLRGYYTTKETAKYIKDFIAMDKVPYKFLKGYDRATGYLKAINFYNPMYMGPNILLNTAIAGSDPFGFAKYTHVIRDKFKHPLYLQAAKDGLFPTRQYIGMKRGMQEMIEDVIRMDKRFITKAGYAAKHPMKSLWKANQKVLWEYMYDGSKLNLYERALKLGMTGKEAANYANKYLVNLASLTGIERDFARRIFFTYPWIKGNLPLQLEIWARTPYKQVAFWRTYNVINKMATGHGLEENPHEKRFHIATPLFNIKGQRIYFKPFLPPKDPLDLIADYKAFIWRRLHPVPTTGMQWLANRKMFTGEHIRTGYEGDIFGFNIPDVLGEGSGQDIEFWAKGLFRPVGQELEALMGGKSMMRKIRGTGIPLDILKLFGGTPSTYGVERGEWEEKRMDEEYSKQSKRALELLPQKTQNKFQKWLEKQQIKKTPESVNKQYLKNMFKHIEKQIQRRGEFEQ